MPNPPPPPPPVLGQQRRKPIPPRGRVPDKPNPPPPPSPVSGQQRRKPIPPKVQKKPDIEYIDPDKRLNRLLDIGDPDVFDDSEDGSDTKGTWPILP